jgi:hypothetical protein
LNVKPAILEAAAMSDRPARNLERALYPDEVRLEVECGKRIMAKPKGSVPRDP